MRRLRGLYLLRELRTNLWDGKEFYATSILNSFFYRSLVEKDRHIYDEYRELVNTTHPDRIKNKKPHIASYENFYAIYEDICDNGYEHGSLITLGPGRKNMGDVIYDGQHRASILLYLDFDIKIKPVRRKLARPIISASSIKQKEHHSGE